MQELGLPLVVVNKEAAYATSVPRSFYEDMAATGHPIGIYLREQQMQSLRNLWNGINQGHIPKLTLSWFFETFTDTQLSTPVGKAALARATANPDDFADVWKQVSKLKAGDDATAVRWADVNKELLSSMYASHGEYVCLALLNLKNVREIADQINELLKSIMLRLFLKAIIVLAIWLPWEAFPMGRQRGIGMNQPNPNGKRPRSSVETTLRGKRRPRQGQPGNARSRSDSRHGPMAASPQ